ncbi:transcription factor 15 [Drosophila innubila]|uniref:transcription factor 15 n=1 Tax=Drosophila innubila TaxID=198719 RepID=UPI00148C7ADD|nr:transcription factor 15 [Drosophila innubila]
MDTINIHASGAHYFSSFDNADCSASDRNAGRDSEDSATDISRKPTAPRQKINARERYRTFNVNSAYEALRCLIPTEPVNRKLSKIEIIRLASSYITHLRSTLNTGTDRQPCLLHKRNNRNAEEIIGVAGRLNICTFCLKPKLPNATQRLS